MKAGFRPKLMTKKEWEDNRSPAVKSSDVGKALDGWQNSCPYNLQDITVKEIAEAFSAASALDRALDGAKKMCDPKAQKETIAGIAAYKEVVASYQKALKAANSALNKRSTLTDSIGFDVVMADNALLAAFTIYAKKKAFNYPVLHTYQLWEAKKFAEAVKLYGKDNDYNVSAKVNTVLLEAFGGKDRGAVDLKVLATAIKSVPGTLTVMLSDKSHYRGSTGGFCFYEPYLAILKSRFPIVDFVL